MSEKEPSAFLWPLS